MQIRDGAVKLNDGRDAKTQATWTMIRGCTYYEPAAAEADLVTVRLEVATRAEWTREVDRCVLLAETRAKILAGKVSAVWTSRRKHSLSNVCDHTSSVVQDLVR